MQRNIWILETFLIAEGVVEAGHNNMLAIEDMWYTDGRKTKNGIGAGTHDIRERESINLLQSW